MTNGELTYTSVTFGERDISVTTPNESQFAVITMQARAFRVAESRNDTKTAIATIGTMLAIVEKLIHPDDREYVVDRMVDGDTDIKEFLALVGVGMEAPVVTKAPARAKRAATRR